MKMYAALLLLLAPKHFTSAQAPTSAEYDGIAACCNDGCEEACDWVAKNPILRPVGTTSAAIGGGGPRARPGFGRRGLQAIRGDDLIAANCCIGNGGSGGDPHILLWNGDYFDYHGECDLVLMDAPKFGQDLGLKIHIRTKIRSDYSYIETASIQIGQDILEVSAFGSHILNGVEAVDLSTEKKHLAAFPIEYQMLNKKRHSISIDLGNDQKIMVNTMKDWVSVSVENATAKDFQSSKGLMGHFFTGTKLARDGYTEMENSDILNAYGQEWQVTPEEAGLFQNTEREPQAPQQQCILPELTNVSTQRRLGAKVVTEEAATLACQHLPDGSLREMCRKDVLAADDVEMAQAMAGPGAY